MKLLKYDGNLGSERAAGIVAKAIKERGLNALSLTNKEGCFIFGSPEDVAIIISTFSPPQSVWQAENQCPTPHELTLQRVKDGLPPCPGLIGLLPKCAQRMFS